MDEILLVIIPLAIILVSSGRLEKDAGEKQLLPLGVFVAVWASGLVIFKELYPLNNIAMVFRGT